MSATGLAISVINIVATVLYLLILARILISWLPISPWNPIVRWLRIVVDPILRPFRRLLPSVAGLDLSPLLAILVLFFVQRLAVSALATGTANLPAAIVLLIAQLIENVIIVLGVLVLIRLIISLFSADPWHPLVMGIRSMTNPLVRPFAGLGRRRGMHSGLDVPALATLIAYVVLYVVVEIVFARLLFAIV